MINLTLEQVKELEEGIKIKDRANFLYKEFMENVVLDAKSFKDGMFKTWSDSYNATYIIADSNGLRLYCKFLHETYTVNINPSHIFQLIKEENRAIAHLEAEISKFKRRKEKIN